MKLVLNQQHYYETHHLLFYVSFISLLLVGQSHQQLYIADQDDGQAQPATRPAAPDNKFQVDSRHQVTTSASRSLPDNSWKTTRSPPSISALVKAKRFEASLSSRQYDSLPIITATNSKLMTFQNETQYQQIQGIEQQARYKSKRDSDLGDSLSGPEHETNGSGEDSATYHRRSDDICSDRLCYGLPKKCLDERPSNQRDKSKIDSSGSMCTVLVTSKQLIDPYRPAARDIHFELVALPVEGRSNYAAVGFSETGRMAGLVSECIQYRDLNTHLQVIKLAHSYNIPSTYTNVPAHVINGIKNLGVSYENGYYQCRWVVESAVDFYYEDPNGTVVSRSEDLGYKNYHILLATGEYNERNQVKNPHTDRIGSMTPISLAQTGHIKSLGAHILIRIHGSLMIAIWIGLVTISVMLARYYKNEWLNSKINDLAMWFVVHRAFMLIAWFGSIISVIFAYVYTETYHPGLHQLSGTSCLILSTIQVIGGLFRPSAESSKRVYFNWTHFICGNLSYLFAMLSVVTAAFLAPAHLPPLYIWVVAAFVAFYALFHLMLTVHQYIIHRSSKISITPMSDLNDSNSSATYSSCGFVADAYPKESNSTFRQLMLGILVTVVVIFIVLLISLVNIK